LSSEILYYLKGLLFAILITLLYWGVRILIGDRDENPIANIFSSERSFFKRFGIFLIDVLLVFALFVAISIIKGKIDF